VLASVVYFCCSLARTFSIAAVTYSGFLGDEEGIEVHSESLSRMNGKESKAMDVARQKGEELSVNLSEVKGSGAGDRITVKERNPDNSGTTRENRRGKPLGFRGREDGVHLVR